MHFATSEGSSQAHGIRPEKINYTIGSLTNLFVLSVTKHRNKNPTFSCKLAKQIDLAAKEISFFFSSYCFFVVTLSPTPPGHSHTSGSLFCPAREDTHVSSCVSRPTSAGDSASKECELLAQALMVAGITGDWAPPTGMCHGLREHPGEVQAKGAVGHRLKGTIPHFLG